MKEFNIIKVHRKVLFLGGGRRGGGVGVTKSQYIMGELPQKGGLDSLQI